MKQNLGHLIQIGMLLLTVGAMWGNLNGQLSHLASTASRVNRIEHYLSSKDQNYWSIVDHDGK